MLTPEQLASTITSEGVMMLDGATGSVLMTKGLAPGESPEIWGCTNPDAITQLHQSYLDVGAGMVLANTFGANRCRLQLHGAAGEARQINRTMAQLARRAVDGAIRHDGKKRLVGGSVGPLGDMIEPHGEMRFDAAVTAFAEQIEGLIEGGIDLIWVETMYAIEEAEAVMTAIGSVCARHFAQAGATAAAILPAGITFSFDTAGKTMMGLSPQDVYQWWRDTAHKPMAIGANCGRDLHDNLIILRDLGSAMTAATVAEAAAMPALTPLGSNTPLVPPILAVKANAGIPEFQNGKIQYRVDAGQMTAYATCARGLGVHIVGGCCGTDADRLAAIHAGLRSNSTVSLESMRAASSASPSASSSLRADGQPQRSRTRRRQSQRKH